MNTVTMELVGIDAVTYMIATSHGTVETGGSPTKTDACYFSLLLDATISDSDGGVYPEFTVNIGGIEWILTCATPGEDDDPDIPVPLSPRTYIDAYGKLHLGDEVKIGDVLTVQAKLVNRNPSGAGYELTSDPITVTIGEPQTNGNFNLAEMYPYISYQPVDSLTPASGIEV